MLKNGDKVQVTKTGEILTIKSNKFLEDLILKGVCISEYTNIIGAEIAIELGYATIVETE